MNLCGLLNSSLFSYFNLMLGSSAGIEREQVFLEELANYPFAYSDELVELVKSTQYTAANGVADEFQHELNKCVLKMYGLEDNAFIDYVLSVQLPMLCGTYQETKCDIKRMKEYALVFSRIWNEHFGDSGVYHTITLYPDIKGKFAALYVKLSLEEKKLKLPNDENQIRSIMLEEYLKKEKDSHGMSDYRFELEVPENYEGKGKHIGRVDIRILLKCDFEKEDAYYGKNIMLGFVVKKIDISKNTKLIEGLQNIHSDSQMHGVFQCVKKNKVTESYRCMYKISSGELELRHIFLDCSKAI